MVSHIALVDGRTVKNPVPRRRRYKKKVEKDEDYIRQVKSLGDAVESSIMQNYAIDIYQVGALSECSLSMADAAQSRWLPQRRNG